MADPRPRILFVGPDYPGGMLTATRALLASPLAERYRIEVLATYRGTAALQQLRVFSVALAKLAWWSLRGRGQIVHIHATVRGSLYRKAICVFVAKTLRRRVILHLHSGPGDIETFVAGLGRPSATFLRLAFRAADLVLAVSRSSAARIREAFAVPGILVVPNPAPPAPAAIDRDRPGAAPLAVYLGGFANPVKGGEVLLAALARPEFADTSFVLAGPGEPPAAARQLIDERPGLRWRGWLDGAAKDELLREADIFVLPSTSEGLPMALLEAMAFGLAIVATAVGGVPDVTSDDVDALVVRPGDSAGLAAAVARLDADAELRVRLGAAARERALEIGPRPVAERLDSIYRELLEVQ